MKKLFIAILLLPVIAAALLMPACCPKITPVSSHRADSVRVVRQTEYIERWRDTTVYVQVPVEVRQQVKKDTSHLETFLASSDAWIDETGLLNHILENRPQKIGVPVQMKDVVTTEQRDSVVYRDNYIKETVTVRHIPRWCWWALAVAVVSVGLNLWRVWKRLGRL